ncbi:tyrosine-type recombinase/integrase [Rubrivirga sp. IMCC45206]|uniref:tyrosine-type recombinase/integrase n=1 Tax=Rubrivirga sp. IMCC45206 TaxID=3391614 RepID=UPI00398FCDFD
MSRGTNPYRAELPDGSRIERAYRKDGKKRVARGNWYWVVYDPDRRPKRKKVNLRTADKGAAMRKALGYAQRRSLGTFDPWAPGVAASSVALTEAAKGYLAEKRHTSAPSTLAEDRRYLDLLAAQLPAGALVSHVEPHHVEAVVNARKRPPKDADGVRRGPGPEATPQTKRRRRASLQPFFAWAVRGGLSPSNPAEGVAVPTSTGARRDHVTDAEAADILRASETAAVEAALAGVPVKRPGWIEDWVTFGLGTGLRPGEQRDLRWSAVRLAERSVEVGRGHRVKTEGSRRTVPVRGNALAVLQRLHGERTTEADGPVFRGATGGRVAVDYLTKRLQALAERAGVNKTVTAYALRHAYGTRMAGAGVPLLDLARLMGTSLRMIERHYAHYDPARGASHVDRVFGAAPSPASAPTREGA